MWCTPLARSVSVGGEGGRRLERPFPANPGTGSDGGYNSLLVATETKIKLIITSTFTMDSSILLLRVSPQCVIF